MNKRMKKRINIQIIFFLLLTAGIGDTITTLCGLDLPDKTEIEYRTMPDGQVLAHEVTKTVFESNTYFVPFLSTLIFAFAVLMINHIGITYNVSPIIQNIIVSTMLIVSFSPTINNLLLIWRW